MASQNNVRNVLKTYSLSGCDSSDDSSPNAPEEPDFIIADEAVIIDSLEVSEPQIEDSIFVFTFTGEPPDISFGDVIIGRTNGGYLRKVTDVSIDGNTITLITEQAALTEVIEKGDLQEVIEIRIGGDGTDAIRKFEPVFLADGVSQADGGIDLDGVELFDGTFTYQDRRVSLSSRITEGYVGFEPDLDLGFRIRDWTLEEFHAIADGEMSFNCELELTCSGGFVYAKDTTIARFHVGTFTQFIGFVPVVEVVYLDFIAGFEAEIAGENTIATGFEFASSIEVGARYQDSR